MNPANKGADKIKTGVFRRGIRTVTAFAMNWSILCSILFTSVLEPGPIAKAPDRKPARLAIIILYTLAFSIHFCVFREGTRQAKLCAVGSSLATLFMLAAGLTQTFTLRNHKEFLLNVWITESLDGNPNPSDPERINANYIAEAKWENIYGASACLTVGCAFLVIICCSLHGHYLNYLQHQIPQKPMPAQSIPEPNGYCEFPGNEVGGKGQLFPLMYLGEGSRSHSMKHSLEDTTTHL